MRRQAGYWGLVDLQFLDTASGPLLIEVNPRFYGSLALALAMAAWTWTPGAVADEQPPQRDLGVDRGRATHAAAPEEDHRGPVRVARLGERGRPPELVTGSCLPSRVVGGCLVRSGFQQQHRAATVGELARHHARHGDGVKVIALSVPDVDEAYSEATARGATGLTPHHDPQDEDGAERMQALIDI